MRYADGVVPCVDGCVLIVDGAPVEGEIEGRKEGRQRGWADYGVDVTVPLGRGDMERLTADPLLFPKILGLQRQCAIFSYLRCGMLVQPSVYDENHSRPVGTSLIRVWDKGVRPNRGHVREFVLECVE